METEAAAPDDGQRRARIEAILHAAIGLLPHFVWNRKAPEPVQEARDLIDFHGEYGISLWSAMELGNDRIAGHDFWKLLRDAAVEMNMDEEISQIDARLAESENARETAFARVRYELLQRLMPMGYRIGADEVNGPFGSHYVEVRRGAGGVRFVWDARESWFVLESGENIAGPPSDA